MPSPYPYASESRPASAPAGLPPAGAGAGPGTGPPDQDTGRRGVIHDIGYRHYDGDRLGRAYVLRSLFVDSLRAAYGFGRSARSKVVPITMLGVMCLVALIVVIVAIAGGMENLPLPYARFAIVMSTVVGIYLAAEAPQLVSRDLRFHVMPLYFSRPLPAGGYALAKYAGMATALFALTGIPLLIMYGGAVLGGMPVWDHTVEVLGALAGAALLSLVLAGLGLLLAALTPRRGFGVASVIAVLLVSYTIVSFAQAIAADEQAQAVGAWLGLLSPFTLVDGVQVWVFGAEPSTPAPPDDALTGIVFLLVTAAFAAATYGLLVLRYRKVARS